MRLASFLLLSTTSLLFTACGSDGDLSPGAGDDVGEGSTTLFVDADVVAAPVVPNAKDPGDFLTTFRVRLERGGVPLTTGLVSVESSQGVVMLTYSGEGNRWVGSQNGYTEVYRLAAKAETDYVDGVKVDGPSVHAFTAPLPGATVDTQAPVMVTWSKSGTAETARIDTDKLDELVIPDSGSYSVPIGGFKSKREEVEQERIRLDRSQRITPLGAVAGSELRVTVRNEISVVVAAAPTL